VLKLSKIWEPRPLHIAVVEILEKKGSIVDVDLHQELKRSYGDVSFRELNETLMKLEIRGVIRVSKLMRGKRMIELACGSAG
jgi:hypothetical protein